MNTEELVHDPWGSRLIGVRLSESFDDIAHQNPELKIEQNANGEIVFMSPTGGESGFRNAAITSELFQWAKSYGGRAFDSSTLFQLPNGAKRSPDASWISAERWSALSREDRKRFPPLCPDFLIELRSESDRLDELQKKMDEYISVGLRLGWLIDPLLKRLHVYQPGMQTDVIIAPDSVSSEKILPGFVLRLDSVWQDS
jgi:Uma2 family endonuclease